MIILDTDCLSLLERKNSEAFFRLSAKLYEMPEIEIATTIVSFEEQMRGWLAFIAKAKTVEKQVVAYRELRVSFDNYRLMNILDFDENAASVFQTLRSSRIRIGTMDLKIASIAISNGALLVSRNLSDFGQVPNLRVEDWAR